MARRTQSEQLDEAVEAMRAGADAPALEEALAELLRIAAELRELPSDSFRARLGADLQSSAQTASDAGEALLTREDAEERLADLAAGPRLIAHDVRAALTGLPELAMRFLEPLDQSTVGVSRFSTHTGWERHPAGDELLHLLEGEAEITTLTAGGPVHSIVRAGSIFVCPQGLWHRIVPRSPVSLLFATPGEGIEHSSAENPLGDGTVEPTAPAPALSAHDLGEALSRLPALKIGDDTTSAEADAAVAEIATLSGASVSVGRFSGQSPWERHANGDELLDVLEGEAEITVLTDDGPLHRTLRAGSVFVCPRGLWHRQYSAEGITALYATPKPTQISFADDPRPEA